MYTILLYYTILYCLFVSLQAVNSKMNGDHHTRYSFNVLAVFVSKAKFWTASLCGVAFFLACFVLVSYSFKTRNGALALLSWCLDLRGRTRSLCVHARRAPWWEAGLHVLDDLFRQGGK